MKRLVLCAVLAASTVAFSEELSPKKAAEIRRDRDKAMKEIDKKYGDKKLSREQLNAKAAEVNEADAKVLGKHGVSPKDYGRYDAKMSRSERAETERQTEGLKKQDEAAAKAAASKKPAKEITVQQGFSEENPTVMDEKEGAPPVVEQGLPAK